jgi:hypothetical protein
LKKGVDFKPWFIVHCIVYKKRRNEGKSMKKICLIFGGILAIVGNAYAVTSTVTSKDYVDTEVGKKQNTIPVSGTNASTPGTTVVTYTDTAGTIGERGILEPGQTVNMQTDANKLVTVAQVGAALQEVANNLPGTTVTYKTCYESQNGDCILWELTDKIDFGPQCTTSADCRNVCEEMGFGCGGSCNNNLCNCYNSCA